MLDYQSIRSTCCRDEQVHARGSRRYFRSGADQGNWVFTAASRYNRGRVVRHELFRASRIPLRRHVKIRAEATVFDSAYRE